MSETNSETVTPQSQGESKNIVMMRAALLTTFQEVAECVGEEEFKSCFPVLQTKLKSKMFKKIRDVLINGFAKDTKEDLEDMLSDEIVQENMKKLLHLIEETHNKDQKAWRPPGKVKSHLKSLDAAKIIESNKSLREYIDSYKDKNEKMEKEIKIRRQNFQNIDKQVMQCLESNYSLLELEKTVSTSEGYVSKMFEET